MAAQSVESVDTTKVSGRRKVHYNDHNELLADVERLQAGGYRYLGNWPLGQVCQHLSNALKSGIDGAPTQPAWPVRAIARFMFKDKAVQGPVKPGFKLPKSGQFLAPDPCEDEQGVAALRETVERWYREPERKPHAFFGKLTPEEWEKLMLNHAEMHMSFIVPKEENEPTQ